MSADADRIARRILTTERTRYEGQAPRDDETLARAYEELRRERDDLRLIAREAIAGRVHQRFDGRGWSFAFHSDRLHFTACSFPDDGTGLPVLTDAARAALRKEGGT